MKVLLVVGASGAGKDTLLRAARDHFASRSGIGFVRRYITRPPDGNEDNYYVDRACFSLLCTSDFFVSSWQAHDNHYGIARHALREGHGSHALVCSISRSAIADFEAVYPEVTTIHVTADTSILRNRLLARKRETDAQIEARLQRARHEVVARNLVKFDNGTSLATGITRFIEVLQRCS